MTNDDLKRIDALLADRATGDLDWDGYRELAGLFEDGQAPGDEMDLAAAALHAALVPEEEAMPAALRSKLERMAPAVLDQAPQEPEQRKPLRDVSHDQIASVEYDKPMRMTWVSWLVAAACAAAAIFFWRQTQPVSPLDSSAQVAQFLLEGQRVQTVAWSATEDPAATGAAGDVLWSNIDQKGYMRIRGLEANNPGEVQYQLWIFDESRENPVDGGVFNIPAGSDEVIVPINAKLQVETPKLFAITVEKPGGVVVSKRERIVLVADPTKSG